MKSFICLTICLLAAQTTFSLPTPADEVDSFSSGFGNLFGKIKTGAKKLWAPKTTEATPTTTTEKEVAVVPLPSTTSTAAPSGLFGLDELLATVVEVKSTTEMSETSTTPETPSSTTPEAEEAATSTTVAPQLVDLNGLLGPLAGITNTTLLPPVASSTEPSDVTAAPQDTTTVASTTEPAATSTTTAAAQATDIPPAHSLN